MRWSLLYNYYSVVDIRYHLDAPAVSVPAADQIMSIKEEEILRTEAAKYIYAVRPNESMSTDMCVCKTIGLTGLCLRI